MIQHPKKAAGYNLNIVKILRKFLLKSKDNQIYILGHLKNELLLVRVKSYSGCLIQKLWNDCTEVLSYRPISLPSALGNLLEELFPIKLKST